MTTNNGKTSWLTPGFIVNTAVLLITVGIAFGSLQISVSSLRAEQARQAEELRAIRNEYLRIDLYEAKHQALRDQIQQMAETVKEIKGLVNKVHRTGV
jgi:hypothetical protein